MAFQTSQIFQLPEISMVWVVSEAVADVTADSTALSSSLVPPIAPYKAASLTLPLGPSASLVRTLLGTLRKRSPRFQRPAPRILGTLSIELVTEHPQFSP